MEYKYSHTLLLKPVLSVSNRSKINSSNLDISLQIYLCDILFWVNFDFVFPVFGSISIYDTTYNIYIYLYVYM